ncbi:hypothetical protein ACFQ6U_17815 [Streptomyces sp. NPDC056465]|uniref:hypothetical protein n=1 Tax=unclassified Streptomyces TaxID=2593676 RepID=UPI0035DF39A2
MVDIFNPTIDGGPVGGENGQDYFFRVRYRAQFDEAEKDDVFSEFVELWEHDGGTIFTGGDDDRLSSVLTPNTFTANPLTINRTFALTLPRSVADTEGGHEAIYARIQLRSSGNLDPAFPADREVRTPHGDFDPEPP